MGIIKKNTEFYVGFKVIKKVPKKSPDKIKANLDNQKEKYNRSIFLFFWLITCFGQTEHFFQDF
jgi:hypothetical protein